MKPFIRQRDRNKVGLGPVSSRAMQPAVIRQRLPGMTAALWILILSGPASAGQFPENDGSPTRSAPADAPQAIDFYQEEARKAKERAAAADREASEYFSRQSDRASGRADEARRMRDAYYGADKIPKAAGKLP